MKKINVTLTIDEDAIKSVSGLDSLNDAINQELGWLHDSGMTVESWSHEAAQIAASINKSEILSEIMKLVQSELNATKLNENNSIGYTIPGGKYHIFISVDNIGSVLCGDELIYRIEPNRIDEDSCAEPMGDIYTADYGDYAELLIGCMWCIEQFEADQQQKSISSGRIEIDLGYATLVAEKGIDPDYKEVFVGLEDKDGVWTQDLAVIGGKYHYAENADLENEVVQDKGVSVKVYSDKDIEDYTHDFSVDIYEPEEEISVASSPNKDDGQSIDLDKLTEYLKEEMIIEFNSDKECMDYFNTYDGQNFKSVEEMKAYQGEYGFGLNGKWYHISFDEALGVRQASFKAPLTEQIKSAQNKAAFGYAKKFPEEKTRDDIRE